MKAKRKIVEKPNKAGYQIVEEKVRIANTYVKNWDMEQLKKVVEQAQMNVSN